MNKVWKTINTVEEYIPRVFCWIVILSNIGGLLLKHLGVGGTIWLFSANICLKRKMFTIYIIPLVSSHLYFTSKSSTMYYLCMIPRKHKFSKEDYFSKSKYSKNWKWLDFVEKNVMMAPKVLKYVVTELTFCFDILVFFPKIQSQNLFCLQIFVKPKFLSYFQFSA